MAETPESTPPWVSGHPPMDNGLLIPAVIRQCLQPKCHATNSVRQDVSVFRCWVCQLETDVALGKPIPRPEPEEVTPA